MEWCGKPARDGSYGPLQWCGSWLHEVGLMGRVDLAHEKRQVVAKMLEQNLVLSESALRD